MHKLSDLFPEKRLKKGDVGIEFECESKTFLPNINTDNWRTDQDPSLRAPVALEYITKLPIKYDRVGVNLNYLFERLKEGEPIKDSPNTSWHIHINALNYTPVKMMTSLFTYWMLEPLLIKYCGPKRKQNTFCLQMCDATDQAMALDEEFFINMIKRPWQALEKVQFNNERRYAAQNLASFVKFGSIEYRAMEGTLDKERIELWIKSLTCIWEKNPYVDPDHLLDDYYRKGPAGVLDNVFNPVLVGARKHIIPLLDKYTTELIDHNSLLLSALTEEYPYTWGDWQEKINKEVEKRRKPVDNFFIDPIKLVDQPEMAGWAVEAVAPGPLQAGNFEFDHAQMRWVNVAPPRHNN